MTTISEMLRTIGDTPVLVALLFVVGIPVILWVYRDLLRWILFGRKS